MSSDLALVAIVAVAVLAIIVGLRLENKDNDDS